jgi:hypothetical protein
MDLSENQDFMVFRDLNVVAVVRRLDAPPISSTLAADVSYSASACRDDHATVLRKLQRSCAHRVTER